MTVSPTGKDKMLKYQMSLFNFGEFTKPILSDMYFFQALQNELSTRDPDLRLLLDKGQRMLDEASPMSDVSDLSDKMDGFKTELGRLKDKVSRRSAKLKSANKLAGSFQGNLDTLRLWLGLNEEKLSEMGPVGLDRNTIVQQIQETQALQAEIVRKSPDQDSLNQEGEKLIQNSEVDQTVIQEALEDVNGRWQQLNQG